MKKALIDAARWLVSVTLLAIDTAFRARGIVVAWLTWLLKVFVYGLVIGVAIEVVLVMTSKMVERIPQGDIMWRDVAWVWGVAFIAMSILGIGWLLSKALLNLGLNLVSQFSQIAARPVVVSEAPRWMGRGAEPAPPQAPAPPRPRGGGGDFVPYSDESGYLNEVREDLLRAGITEENVAEMLKKVGKGAEA